VTGADTVGDQLRGLVDPSGTPLHGCVMYRDEALLTVAPGAAEALSDVHSRVFEGSDPEVATVTGVDMVDDLLRGSVIEVETGEIEMEGDYVRAAKVDKIRGKEVNVYNIVVDEVMAITDVVTIVAADSGAEIMDPVKPESPFTSRWKWDPRLPMKRGHFEHDPIEVLDNNKSKGPRRRMVSNFSNVSLKNAAVLPPPSKRSESRGILHASMTTLDGHSEGQDGYNPDDRATSPPYPCESEVKQTDSRAAEEGKQSGVQQLDNETKNSIADEDDDGGCVLHDLLKDYTSDSAEPSDNGNLGEPERVLLALETNPPEATSASIVATHNCGVDMNLNQDMLVDVMRPGGPLQSCGNIMFGDRRVCVDDIKILSSGKSGQKCPYILHVMRLLSQYISTAKPHWHLTSICQGAPYTLLLQRHAAHMPQIRPPALAYLPIVTPFTTVCVLLCLY